MISKLKKPDMKRAATLFKKSLKLEIPKGSMTTKEIFEVLNDSHTLVYRSGSSIRGLVSFKEKNRNLQIEFICVDRPGKGIGFVLMNGVAKYAKKRGIRYVRSTASSLDRRAMGFYTALGFKNYGMVSFCYKVKATPREIINKTSA